MQGKYARSSGLEDATFAPNAVVPASPRRNLNNLVFWSAVGGSYVIGIVLLVLIVVLVEKHFGGLSWQGSQKFNYHPLFMVIGLALIYGNAIIAYRVFSKAPKIHLKIIHAYLLLAALVFTIVALVAVFEYKREGIGSTDMYTLHSWVGMSTCILFFLQYVIGFTVFLVPSIPMSWRSKIMPFHTFFGLSIFVMAIGSTLTGLNEKLQWMPNYSRFPAAGVMGNSFALLLILYGFVIAFVVVNSNYKRQPRPDEIAMATTNTAAVN